jgi:hypothetical protein
MEILIAMQMGQYKNAGRIPRSTTSRVIWQVPVPCCPSGCQGHQFQAKHKNTNKTQLLLLASQLTLNPAKSCENFGPQNGPSTQLIYMQP